MTLRQVSFVLFVFLFLSLAGSAVITQVSVTFSSLRALWVFPLCFAGCYLALVLLFLLVMLIAGLLADPEKPEQKASRFYRFILNAFCRIAFFFGGVAVHSTGLEKVPADGRFLLVSNHVTIFDPLVFYHEIPQAQLAFIAKKEAMKMFLVGGFLRKTLSLPIDRENDREALKTIRQAVQHIQDDKVSYAIFPEGKCNETGELLLPYRSGAFKIAQKTGIPIVVCCTAGTKRIQKQMFRRHTDLYLDVLDVIPADYVASHSTIEVAELVHPIMLAGLQTRADAI